MRNSLTFCICCALKGMLSYFGNIRKLFRFLNYDRESVYYRESCLWLRVRCITDSPVYDREFCCELLLALQETLESMMTILIRTYLACIHFLCRRNPSPPPPGHLFISPHIIKACSLISDTCQAWYLIQV